MCPAPHIKTHSPPRPVEFWPCPTLPREKKPSPSIPNRKHSDKQIQFEVSGLKRLHCNILPFEECNLQSSLVRLYGHLPFLLWERSPESRQSCGGHPDTQCCGWNKKTFIIVSTILTDKCLIVKASCSLIICHLHVQDGGPVRECLDSPATRHLRRDANQLDIYVGTWD